MSFVVYWSGDSDNVVAEFDTRDEAQDYCFHRNHPLGKFYTPNNYHYFTEIEIGDDEE